MTSLASPNTLRSAAATALLLALAAAAHAADITQTATGASGTDWNNATVWGGSAPTTGNDYFTFASGTTATTRLGTGSAVGFRVRETGTTFGGDSLTIVGATELLLKQTANQTSTGNIILNGGVLRLSAGASAQATLAGTLQVASESWLGVADTGTPVLSVTSALSGAGLLHVAAGLGTGGSTVSFSGDLSAFTGTFAIGGGDQPGIVSFTQAYDLSGASMSINTLRTDVLNLNGNLTVGAFSFGSTVFDPGIYSLVDLNADFGNGSQFTGTGNLIVGAIPEPSSFAVIAGMAGLALAGARRRHARR